MTLLATAPIDAPAWLILPFALLLLLIAVMPLTPPRLKAWWDHSYAKVAAALALFVAIYYLWRVPAGGERLLLGAGDYFSFIMLIGSLYVIAGGIHVRVKGEATPWHNVVFLLVAALLANVIGTTGASMVLIRPFLRMNKIRAGAHHVVFFIFLVSNVGGALTPIGDPPLFLGYLHGVPFFWLLAHVLPAWIFTVGAILAAFYVFDRRSFRHAPPRIQHEIEQAPESWRVEGLVNLPLLAAVIGAVFLPDRWFVRELVMGAAAAASYRFTPAPVHQSNHFSFGPIKEVAWLFLGIFATMLPALDYLEAHGREFALTHPAQYYFAAGALSSVLDNAPTYVNFFKLAEVRLAGGGPVEVLLAQAPLTLAAVSLGAVFFGAMTYIGNGPNFMVKSIAHDTGVHTPSFFAYIFKYSLPVLLPILALTAWLFL